MSLETVTQRIWQHSKMTGVNKLILLALAQFTAEDDDGFCWPGYEVLGGMIGLSGKPKSIKRNAMRNLSFAIEAGEIMVWEQQGQRGGRGYTNIYLITVGLSSEQIKEIINRRIGEKRVSIETLLETRATKRGDNIDTLIDVKGDKNITLYTDMSDKVDTLKPVEGQKGDESITRINKDNDNNKQDIKEFWRIFESEIGAFSSIISNRIDKYTEECPIAWMIEAIDVCVENNVRKPVYLYSVIENSIAFKLPPRLAWSAKKDTEAPKITAQIKDSKKGPVRGAPVTFSSVVPDLPPPPSLTPEESTWQAAQAILQQQMTRQTYDDLLRGATATRRKNGTFTLTAPNEQAREWIVNRLYKTVSNVLKTIDPTINEIEVMI